MLFDIYLGTQFSIFLVNKPGVLAQTLNAIADKKVNIIAMTMMDSVEHGALRVMAAKHDEAREVLKRLNVAFNETDVICVTLSNKSGAFADIVTQLADAHININYAYCTAGARGGRTTGVLKVADMKKALKILNGDKTKKQNK
jgi:hypothetical protein